jgi:hypothetical protein
MTEEKASRKPCTKQSKLYFKEEEKEDEKNTSD